MDAAATTSPPAWIRTLAGTPLAPDPWLADILGTPAAHWSVADACPRTPLPAALLAAPAFITAKVPVANQAAQHFFRRHGGFALVDIAVTFACPRDQLRGAAPTNTIRDAAPEDQAAVTELAARSFRHSRFHADPRIPTDLANRIKQAWAANFFRGRRGDRMVVAVVDNQVAGFLQLLVDPPQLTIDLIAVGEAWQQRGIAGGMITYAARTTPDCTVLRVGTQLANIPSIRLYERLGFRLVAAQHVYHLHAPLTDPQP
jgi:ribosomal protein S18 acetylase RimI-like enzyme